MDPNLMLNLITDYRIDSVSLLPAAPVDFKVAHPFDRVYPYDGFLNYTMKFSDIPNAMNFTEMLHDHEPEASFDTSVSESSKGGVYVAARMSNKKANTDFMKKFDDLRVGQLWDSTGVRWFDDDKVAVDYTVGLQTQRVGPTGGPHPVMLVELYKGEHQPRDPSARVGKACLSFTSPDGSLFCPNVLSLEIMDGNRREGLGTLLLRETMRLLDSHYFHEMIVPDQNDPTVRKFLESCGFINMTAWRMAFYYASIKGTSNRK